jgi:hypothetical protein
MECSLIPPADTWSNLEPHDVRRYRAHVMECVPCRKRAGREAPDEFLFVLEDPSLPPDFWIGFWPSLERKIAAPAPARSKLRFIRWAAVFICGAFLLQTVPKREQPISTTNRIPVLQTEASQRPLVEEVQNPNATYYIFQSGNKENIVMIFDPDLDL